MPWFSIFPTPDVKFAVKQLGYEIWTKRCLFKKAVERLPFDTSLRGSIEHNRVKVEIVWSKFVGSLPESSIRSLSDSKQINKI